MTPTREQRAMMAADLWMRAAVMALRGEVDCAPSVSTCAEFVIERDDPEDYYREGLTTVGLSPDDIDAAVASIVRGEHPAGSLSAQVTKMYDDAANGLPHDGTELTLFRVLGLLGCKVMP